MMLMGKLGGAMMMDKLCLQVASTADMPPLYFYGGYITSEIEKIKQRNRRVEADKAWETSIARRSLIAIATYLIVVVFLFSISAPNPFISALVPAIGYIISTLSLPFIKNFWIKKYYRK